jgi:hypothetical protein
MLSGVPVVNFLCVSYPPDIEPFLTSTAVTSKIGAESEWQETNFDVYDNFAATGDWMTNSRLNLETVIKAGVSMNLAN